MVRIFKNLSTIKAPPSSTDLTNDHPHDGFASWYRNNEALMESCKAGGCCGLDPIIQLYVNDEQHASDDQ